MAMNPQLIKRKGSHLYIHTVETVPVGDNENIAELEKQGFHFIHTVMPDGDEVVRRSKKVDGYTRDTSIPWDKTAEIFPFEEDQLVWTSLVKWWFDGARADEQYVSMLEATYKTVDVTKMLNAAEQSMARRYAKGKGKQGKRRGDIHKWFVNERNSFADDYARAMQPKKNQ